MGSLQASEGTDKAFTFFFFFYTVDFLSMILWYPCSHWKPKIFVLQVVFYLRRNILHLCKANEHFATNEK